MAAESTAETAQTVGEKMEDGAARMGGAGEETSRPHRVRGGRAGKREAILRGALRVFARDGYLQASIESIAAEAVVSTRTIYNHFADKADLYSAVVGDSARSVSEVEIGLVDSCLRDGEAPEAELVAFARAWLAPDRSDADHVALMRQLGSGADRVPAEAVAAWRDAGPLRVRHALADRLSAWGERGVLQIDDAVHAAVHLTQLIAAAAPGPMSGATSRGETDAWIISGVRAFLYGYRRT